MCVSITFNLTRPLLPAQTHKIPLKVADLPSFLNQVLERFPLISDLSMMRNPACPGLMDVKRPDMEACRLYRTYVVFRAPQLVTVDGVDVTEEVSLGVDWLCFCERRGMTGIPPPWLCFLLRTADFAGVFGFRARYGEQRWCEVSCVRDSAARSTTASKEAYHAIMVNELVGSSPSLGTERGEATAQNIAFKVVHCTFASTPPRRESVLQDSC